MQAAKMKGSCDGSAYAIVVQRQRFVLQGHIDQQDNDNSEYCIVTTRICELIGRSPESSVGFRRLARLDAVEPFPENLAIAEKSMWIKGRNGPPYKKLIG